MSFKVLLISFTTASIVLVPTTGQLHDLLI